MFLGRVLKNEQLDGHLKMLLRALFLRLRAFFKLCPMAPHKVILLLHRANRCNVLHRVKSFDEILCQSRLTERMCIALPSTTITCHRRGTNVWPRTLTENAEAVRFDHTAKGAKALIEVVRVEV